MGKVMGVEFGASADAVYWLAQYLATRYGTTCIYATATPDIRLALFAPTDAAHISVLGPLNTVPEALGVVCSIQPHKGGARVRAGKTTGGKATVPVSSRILAGIINVWYEDVLFKVAKSKSFNYIT